MCETKSKNHYNFKSDFETRREIQDFGRQNYPVSSPTLDSTPLGTNNTNRTTSPIDSIPVGKKCQILCHWHDQHNFQSKIEKYTYQGTRNQIHNCQTHHRRNIICQMIAVLVNQRRINAIRRKIIGKEGKMICQPHHWATILIRPTIVIIDTNDLREIPIRKRIR